MKQEQKPIKEDKHYIVNLEGTEPFHATRDEALAWLWCSRVEKSKCWIYTARDPGAVHADKLELSNMPEKGTPVYNKVMELFGSAEADDCACWLRELLISFPGSVGADDADPSGLTIVWSAYEITEATVELHIKSIWALRRKCHQYEVVSDCGTDCVDHYIGHKRREALRVFASKVAWLCFGQKIAEMEKE